MKRDPDRKPVASNRRASYDFEILERIEAGLGLTGSEVKSLRAGQAVLKDAYAIIRGGEAFVIGLHIAPYGFAREGGHEPERTRKLLLHRREIDRLAAKLAQQGLTLIPIAIYFRRGHAKLELGLGKGKRTVDKRRSIRDREERRELQRAHSPRRVS